MNAKKWFGTMALAGTVVLAAAGLPERAPAAPPAEASPSLRLEVDISDRKLYVYHSGSVMHTFDVAVGEPEHPTPKGDFTINRIIWNPAWVPPPNAEWAEDKEKKAPNDSDNPMVGAKLFFEYPDYYIHGTDATHTLGQAESHGCVRMDPKDVKLLGELVQKHGGESRDQGWFGWVKKDDRSKHEIKLPDPVPVAIHE